MTSEQPLVSVFMPTYQHEEFIADAIESALNQTYQNVELVIGDDCSTDGTWAIVEEYQRKYPEKIRAVRNEVNLGITGNCNAIISRCWGKYVAFFSGDDLWQPEKLERQVTLMEAEPDCVFSYHDIDVFDSETGEHLYAWNSGPSRPAPIEGENAQFLEKLIEFRAGFMAALSIMIRRSAVPCDAPFDVRIPHLSELNMWVNVLYGKKGKVRYIPARMANYRKHPGGITQKNHDVEMGFFLSIVENEFPELALAVRRARGRLYYTRGVKAVLAGDGNLGRIFLKNSMRYKLQTVKVLYWLMRAYLLGSQKERES